MEVRINIKTKQILHLKINHWVEVGQETETNDKNKYNPLKNIGQRKGNIILKSQKKNL